VFVEYIAPYDANNEKIITPIMIVAPTNINDDKDSMLYSLIIKEKRQS
jgi:hypothetical protein